MNAPDKAVAFEALMKDTPGFDHYDSGYYNIAAKCDKETMLQREYTPDCMDKRNRYMVDHADYILAVWNGCPSGTGNTVRYAHKKGKSIIVINPVSLDVTRE